MSEASTGEVLAQFEGTPFEQIAQHILVTKGQLEERTIEYEALREARLVAIRAIDEQHNPAIHEAKQRVDELKNAIGSVAIGEHLRSMDMTPLLKAAFDIELRRSGQTVTDFADGFSEIIDGESVLFRSASVLEKVLGFNSFVQDLEQADQPVPYGVIKLEWCALDGPEYYGHGSRSPQYVKFCTGYFGATTRDDIHLQHEDLATETDDFAEVLRPASITLKLDGSTCVSTYQDWYDAEVKTEVMGEGSALSLIDSDSRGSTIGKLGNVDWAASKALDFSMTHDGIHGKVRDDSRVFLVWGDNVGRAIDLLGEDPHVPQVTKDALRQSQQYISSVTSP